MTLRAGRRKHRALFRRRSSSIAGLPPPSALTRIGHWFSLIVRLYRGHLQLEPDLPLAKKRRVADDSFNRRWTGANDFHIGRWTGPRLHPHHFRQLAGVRSCVAMCSTCRRLAAERSCRAWQDLNQKRDGLIGFSVVRRISTNLPDSGIGRRTPAGDSVGGPEQLHSDQRTQSAGPSAIYILVLLLGRWCWVYVGGSVQTGDSVSVGRGQLLGL